MQVDNISREKLLHMIMGKWNSVQNIWYNMRVYSTGTTDDKDLYAMQMRWSQVKCYTYQVSQQSAQAFK
jgi:hypothetical protein